MKFILLVVIQVMTWVGYVYSQAPVSVRLSNVESYALLVNQFINGRCQVVEPWWEPKDLPNIHQHNPFDLHCTRGKLYPFNVLFRVSQQNKWKQLSSGKLKVEDIQYRPLTEGYYAFLLLDMRIPALLLVHYDNEQYHFTFYQNCVLH